MVMGYVRVWISLIQRILRIRDIRVLGMLRVCAPLELLLLLFTQLHLADSMHLLLLLGVEHFLLVHLGGSLGGHWSGMCVLRCHGVCPPAWSRIRRIVCFSQVAQELELVVGVGR